MVEYFHERYTPKDNLEFWVDTQPHFKFADCIYDSMQHGFLVVKGEPLYSGYVYNKLVPDFFLRNKSGTKLSARELSSTRNEILSSRALSFVPVLFRRTRVPSTVTCRTVRELRSSTVLRKKIQYVGTRLI